MARSPRPEGRATELRVDALAAGGDGVARDADGRVVFVPRAAPGDRLRARVVSEGKRFARAEWTELLEPGPDRVEPACPRFGRCGGCAWQHLDYAAQLDAKATIVRDALRRIGRFEDPGPVPITPSPRPLGYRTRARFVQWDGGLGYRARRSHRVEVTRECPVLDPRLEAALRSERPASEGADGDEWEAALGSDGRLRLGRIGTPGGAVELRVGDDRLRVSHEVFAQANGPLLETLASRVVARACEGATSRVAAVELYAGAGLFTLGLARRFDQVWAVESHPGGVADLRFNLGRAGQEHVRVHEGDAAEVLPRLGVREPDLLLLDPPRAGVAPEGIAAIAGVAPRRIVYLSCDPATFARDLALLCDEGWRLGDVEAFDLFPQTPHVEALASLERPGRPV